MTDRADKVADRSRIVTDRTGKVADRSRIVTDRADKVTDYAGRIGGFYDDKAMQS